MQQFYLLFEILFFFLQGIHQEPDNKNYSINKEEHKNHTKQVDVPNHLQNKQTLFREIRISSL